MTRPSNEELVEIDGEPLPLSDLLSSLKFEDKLDAVQEAIVRFVLKRAYVEYDISAAQEEIALHMNSFRGQRGLLSGQATKNWLEKRYLSDQEFVELIEHEVKLRKLKEMLADGKIEQRFAYEKLSLDRVELYRIMVDDESVAKELLAQAREGANFFGLAKMYSVDEQTRRQCGYLGVVKRNDLRPEVESLVFNCRPGDIVGPVRSAGKFHIYYIEELCPARLDESTRELIVEQIFREWLDRRLKDSDIEILI